MRLKSIKLAGFKSFVDPTEIPLPTNLTAIVGPNGCGKSNVIDAVRWVLGESSAKHLRGESMADVIFNGSKARKPLGQASVELVFDNRERKLGGAYAVYDEIAVKRLVTRDGQSTYFLNASRCRRKDITDIFLGTGLGARSYAIIEQGMISRLIEAKPHELRVFIEEAAGISKYKERRRETELRMNRTRENLERLEDIREELARQLEKLDQQSKDARQFQRLQAEQKQAEAELTALRWRRFEQALARSDQAILALETELEGVYAQRIAAETGLESHRASHHTLVESCEKAQGEYYALGTQIAQLEQQIEHMGAQQTALKEEEARAQASIDQFLEHNEKDQGRMRDIRASLATCEPDLEAANLLFEEAEAVLEQAESDRSQWQAQWEQIQQAGSGAREQAQVQQSALNHLESNIERFHQQQVKLEQETKDLSVDGLKAEVSEFRVQMETCEAQVETYEIALAGIEQKIASHRDQITELSASQREAAASIQKKLGELSSLEALQKAALGDRDKAFKAWVRESGLSLEKPFMQQLEVAAGWELAMEEVLGVYMQGYMGPALSKQDLDRLGTSPQSVMLLEPIADAQMEPDSASPVFAGRKTLLDQLANSPALEQVVAYLAPSIDLSRIYCVDSLSEAHALRDQLGARDSLITQTGCWLSRHWVRVFKKTSPEQGALARQQRIRALSESVAQTQDTLNQLEQQLKTARVELGELERDRNESFQALNEANSGLNHARSQVSSREARIEQIKSRLARVNQEQQDIQGFVRAEEAKMSEARRVLEVAIEKMDQFESQKALLLAQKDETQSTYEDAKDQVHGCRDRRHALNVEVSGLRGELETLEKSTIRSDTQIAQLSERKSHIREQLDRLHDPSELKPKLDAQLEKQLEAEQNWSQLKQQLSELDHQMAEYTSQREKAQGESERIREALEQKRLKRQTEQTQIEVQREQAATLQINLSELAAALPESATESAWDQNIKALGRQIEALGAINLAAIEDFETQSQRKVYLDEQFADLTDALETLNQAIIAIDQETKAKFKETFDQVNECLKTRFPKVFGGGSASLELNDEDLLEAGVTIMARPPGKRNATIHLLSGGEKALTAIALVFSIFQLNPAPFCMLDEVDAPLDDANVGRYSRMVADMSKTLQFIYISHNKVAMEMASQLMGVTMHEPGVSRIVSVDVERLDPDNANVLPETEFNVDQPVQAEAADAPV